MLVEYAVPVTRLQLEQWQSVWGLMSATGYPKHSRQAHYLDRFMTKCKSDFSTQAFSSHHFGHVQFEGRICRVIECVCVRCSLSKRYSRTQ